MTNNTEKPIFRWAGGKSWLLKELARFLPPHYNNYHEPFLGGGSVFFFLKPKGISFLSDFNADLINAYRELRDNVEEVIEQLKRLQNTEKEYYRIRNLRLYKSINKAAQFIYLNRTGFNGLYRVNLKGRYNVPYGFKTYKQLFDFEQYKKASEILKKVKLSCDDFVNSIDNVESNDLVFLDPPYTATYIKNGFIKYNETLFSWEDQERLALYIEKIINRNAHYILTNAKHKRVEALFKKYSSPKTVQRVSLIGGKNAKRGIVEEYIFTNTI